MDALRTIISIHEPRFYSIVNDLTDHQLSLLLAILDGVTRFSASDVIEKYRLNSSANVRRVKDALKKKEVITFNEKDEPVILDPLFEYWVNNHYFERR
jgi:sulfite reductase alpha subunit-like flavoprotein